MYCQKCGRVIPDDSVFCNFCGAPQQAQPAAAAPVKTEEELATERKTQQRNRVLSGVAIVLVIAILAALLWIFRPTPVNATRKFLNAVQRQNWRTAQRYYSGNPAHLQMPSASTFESLGTGGADFYEQLMDKLTDFHYSIGGVTRHGSNAEVQVTITTYNFRQFVSDARKDLGKEGISLVSNLWNSLLGKAAGSSSASIFPALSEDLGKLTTQSVTTTCTFYVQRSGRIRWKVSRLGPEQLDALTGGGYSALTSFLQSGNSSSGKDSGAGSTIAEGINEAVNSFGDLAKQAEQELSKYVK